MLRVILTAWILVSAALAEQTVEGHVVNSATGAGMTGVAVSLMQGEKSYTATTDFQGHFRIEGVKNGAYTADFTAAHFRPARDPEVNPPLEVQVATGPDSVRLDAKMLPLGKISGRVFDASGKPFPGATIWFRWQKNFSFLFHESITDEKGEYTIADLEVPSVWRLSATANSSPKTLELVDGQRLGWAQTYYPGVTDPQLAAKVVVRPGEELWLDFNMVALPVHRVRGVVVDVNGDPAPKSSVILGKGNNRESFRYITTKDDGTFEFGSVTDGEWKVTTTVNRENVKLWASQDIVLKGDNLEHVELRLSPPFSIQGKIVMDVPEGVPAPQLPGIAYEISSGTPGDGFVTVKPDEKGNFTIQNLYPGLYAFLPENPPAPYYLDTIRLDGRDALQLRLPILSGGQSLTVIYKRSGGIVRGTVEGCGGGKVGLIPQDPELRHFPFLRGTTCDPNGRFEMSLVRPGEYYGLALAADTTGNEGEMESFLSQGSKVTVRTGESTSADIHLIKQ